ncbi:GH32 C-terminal domain-containing protein [Serratia nevei]
MNRRKFIFSSVCLGAGMGMTRASFSQESTQPMPPVNYRPQVHYAPITGFMNDPNGLVFYRGEYHLFYQHNPVAAAMGNVHWGHAISNDLLNWRTLPTALANSAAGQAFSGSAVNDAQNSSGLFDNLSGGLVLVYTRAGATVQTQEIAFSHDEGKTFTGYSRNPVLDIDSDQFRDPKVFWYSAEKCWIMTVVDARKHRVLFYRSDDLKAWIKLSEFADAGLLGVDYECPDLLCVPVEGGGEKWVLFLSINPGAPQGGSTVQYFVGDFDGQRFIPVDRATRLMDFGKDYYAFQSFSGTSGVPIGLAWLSNWQYANFVPFTSSRGMMTLPRRIGLRQIKGDWRITQQFVDLSPLVQRVLVEKPHLTGSDILLSHPVPAGEALDIELDINLSAGAVFTLRFSNSQGESLDVGFDGGDFGGLFIERGKTAGFSHRYFVNSFSYALAPGTRNTDMRLILDRTSLELLGDKGAASGTALYFSTSHFDRLTLLVEGGEATVNQLKVRTLRAITSESEAAQGNL